MSDEGTISGYLTFAGLKYLLVSSQKTANAENFIVSPGSFLYTPALKHSGISGMVSMILYQYLCILEIQSRGKYMKELKSMINSPFTAHLWCNVVV